jgi:hypothetical protein
MKMKRMIFRIFTILITPRRCIVMVQGVVMMVGVEVVEEEEEEVIFSI